MSKNVLASVATLRDAADSSDDILRKPMSIYKIAEIICDKRQSSLPPPSKRDYFCIADAAAVLTRVRFDKPETWAAALNDIHDYWRSRQDLPTEPHFSKDRWDTMETRCEAADLSEVTKEFRMHNAWMADKDFRANPTKHAANDQEESLQLGRKVELPKSPEEAKLDWVEFSLGMKPSYQVRLVCPEFTSLCPVTGQPDFATIVIDYVPGLALIESKSLKLYLGSFRNQGAYHEAIVNEIASRLYFDKRESISGPAWVRVIGYFGSRGGISIQPMCERGELPDTIEPRPLPDRWTL